MAMVFAAEKMIPNAVDLCSDDDVETTCKKPKTQHHIMEEGESEISNAYNIGAPDEDDITSSLTFPQTALCRHFWKAGDYQLQHGHLYSSPNQNKLNRLTVHPKFLHSNATSHKWVFGAVAELLDNVVDEIRNGATFADVKKIQNPRDGSPALLIQDNGGGMDPEAMRHCLGFGFSKKAKTDIGQYGNGFKTSTMRLGADVILFTRNNKTRTQSVGLLSYTSLMSLGHNKILVPVVDYEFNESAASIRPIISNGMTNFQGNLSLLLDWCPYSTEEQLLKQFDDIGERGTKVVIYNLWLNQDGDMELDFDSDIEDIRINGSSSLPQFTNSSKPISEQYIANRYHYSLRAYISILYLRLKHPFHIKLCGRVVEHHNIANDLLFHEYILYKPRTTGKDQVITTIGFLKEASDVKAYGFNIYHRNRLILPFWHVLKNVGGSSRRGIVGVLEANCIEPTHNKQDFERTSLFQKLEERLKLMTVEYWQTHHEFIAHQVISTSASALPSHEIHSHISSEEHASVGIENSGVTSASSDVVARRTKGRPRKNQIRTPLGPIVRQNPNVPPLSQECAVDACNVREEQHNFRSEIELERAKITILLQENRNLSKQILELEYRVEGFNMKVEKLKSELHKVQSEY
ncbi:Histidine kinase- DNA gyrase B- and HSP90-like ATPase family protein [Euphorbia peplus]|nr:Histidine kinase- DNA gyrase B- and HSP90-like ATPase family protein [Euphorbia peplus]